MALRFLDGVMPHGLRPELILAYLAARDIWDANGFDIWLASMIDDPEHALETAWHHEHRSGTAFDILMGRVIPTASHASLTRNLNGRLPIDYTVHYRAGPPAFLHISFVPLDTWRFPTRRILFKTVTEAALGSDTLTVIP